MIAAPLEGNDAQVRRVLGSSITGMVPQKTREPLGSHPVVAPVERCHRAAEVRRLARMRIPAQMNT